MRSRPLRRNAASGEETQRRRHSGGPGRLRLGSVDCLPPLAEAFDKVLAVNAIMFLGADD